MMNIKINSKENQIDIAIEGIIDELGAEELEKCFNQLDVESVLKVILNFSKVIYIGSAGVGSLLLLYKKLAPANGQVVIKDLPKDIYELLMHDMNLGQIFTLHSK